MIIARVNDNGATVVIRYYYSTNLISLLILRHHRTIITEYFRYAHKRVYADIAYALNSNYGFNADINIQCI